MYILGLQRLHEGQSTYFVLCNCCLFSSCPFIICVYGSMDQM